MDMNSVSSLLAAEQRGTSQGAGRTQQTAAGKASFIRQMQDTRAAGAEAYMTYLKSRYGDAVAKNVDKDQRSMDALGAGTAGTGNVVIAPSIVEQMANDPEKAAYYEGKIRNYFNSVPRYQAELSAMGHEIHSSGIVIHADGTVTHYISGDLKPEVRARIEAQVRAEQEEKASRKRQYAELNAAAADKRRLMEKLYQQTQRTAEALSNWSNGTENIYVIDMGVTAHAAHENAAGTALGLPTLPAAAAAALLQQFRQRG